jgi:hypothetical protein
MPELHKNKGQRAESLRFHSFVANGAQFVSQIRLNPNFPVQNSV